MTEGTLVCACVRKTMREVRESHFHSLTTNFIDQETIWLLKKHILCAVYGLFFW